MNPVARLMLNLGMILINVFTITVTKSPVMFLICTCLVLICLWSIKVSIEEINATKKKHSDKEIEPKKNRSSVKKL